MCLVTEYNQSVCLACVGNVRTKQYNRKRMSQAAECFYYVSQLRYNIK